MNLSLRTSLAAVAAAAFSTSALAFQVTGTYSPDGNTAGTEGAWILSATGAPVYTYSNLYFDVNEDFTFSQLTHLSADYNSVVGGIAGGSPRFGIGIDLDDSGTWSLGDGWVQVLWGPAGSFVDPTPGPGNTGNVIAMNDNGRYDLSQVGGSAYTNYAAALALVGDKKVLSGDIIVDAYADGDVRLFETDGVNMQAVPEPTSMVALGLGALALIRRRRSAK